MSYEEPVRRIAKEPLVPIDEMTVEQLEEFVKELKDKLDKKERRIRNKKK